MPQNEATPLGNGMLARFRLREGSEKSYTARIQLVGAAADSRDRMVAVTAEVDDPAREELRPGTFVEVEVPIGGVAAAASGKFSSEGIHRSGPRSATMS